MIKFIPIEENGLWDNLICSIPNHDVYYLSGYVKAFQINGDGIPTLVWWERDKIKAACVLMIRDIAEDPHFKELERNKYFDAITPYGYGGFIYNSDPTEEDISSLSKDFFDLLQQYGIISVFFRFHPILKNAQLSRDLCQVIDLGKTISLDLKDEETIWKNITSKNRNVIRKAEKFGVQIHHGKGLDILSKFKEIYDETMRLDNADEYYFFKDDFYESIDKDLNENYEVFYATLGENIISMAIIIFDNKQMHYHLSGSKREFRSYAPSNLLLFKVAIWGMEKGYETFHLGGGVGSGEDPLYKFKSSFNRNSDNQFSIGKLITNQNDYHDLISMRKSKNKINENINFFPLYRS